MLSTGEWDVNGPSVSLSPIEILYRGIIEVMLEALVECLCEHWIVKSLDDSSETLDRDPASQMTVSAPTLETNRVKGSADLSLTDSLTLHVLAHAKPSSKSGDND